MANVLLDPSDVCQGRRKDGQPCGAPHVVGSVYCVQHDAPSRERLRARYHAARDATIVRPTLQLDEVAKLDVTKPEGLASARLAVWQHLLAGTLEPHVAKTALDIAESIARNARPTSDGKRSAMADVMASVVGTVPPQQDE